MDSSLREGDDPPICGYWLRQHFEFWRHPVTGQVLCAICRPPRGLAPVEVVD